jgi:N-acetylmuramoyl-L-alanine amidase
MRQLKGISVFITIILFFTVFASYSDISYAADSKGENDFREGSYYYLIYYNGEKQEIYVTENTTINLSGWTDNEHSTLTGTITTKNDETKNFTAAVSNQLVELSINSNETIYLRIVSSEIFKVEIVTPVQLTDQVNVIEKNENGTFIEEVTTTDEHGTIIKKEGPTYYSINEENKKLEISKEDYYSINRNSVNISSANNSGTVQTYSLSTPSVSYSTHIQSFGWMDYVKNGATSGTVGEAKRLEAIKIKLDNAPYNGGISYTTHVQSYGWISDTSDNKSSGTEGESKRLEAIKIKLTGQMAEHYDVYYRVHAQSYGWLDWAKNGEPAGTQGLAKRLEAIEIKLVEKGGDAPESTTRPFVAAPSVSYSTHVQSYGWLDYKKDGATSGTLGKAKRVEAIKIKLENTTYNGNITYSTHVQSDGWIDNVSNNTISGTSGESKRLEAIKINLTGEIAEHYDIYYRVYTQTFGWLDWAKNGEPAGTEGLSKRLEAIEIRLVNKGANAPGITTKAFLTAPSVVYSTHVESYGWFNTVANGSTSGTQGEGKRLEAIKISLKNSPYSGDITYSTHVQSYGWLKNVSNGTMSGTSGQRKRMEAIQINLTGQIANYYDVYYRVHVQSYGWLGWAKNGMKAGTEGFGKRLEAIEVKLVPKGKGTSVSQAAAFKQPLTVFVDAGHGGGDTGAVSGGTEEKDINLVVAKKVQSLLENRGYTVYMSRTNDSYIGLNDRAQKANNLNTDIFVSIHTNSTGRGSTTATGIETYYYEYDPSYPSKINQAMHNNRDRVSKSVSLANLIQKNLTQVTGATNRGTDGASFAVIRETKMPAVLVEVGFINNSNERNKLVSSSYQNKLATGIVNGIDAYFKVY